MFSTRMRALVGRRALAVAAAAALAAGPALLSPAAQAAVPHRNTVTHADHASVTNGAVLPHTTCGLTVYNPFVNGLQVWGWDYISCSGQVYSISTTVVLYYNGTAVQTASATVMNDNMDGATAKYTNESGNWQTCAQAYVYWSSTIYSVLGPSCSPVVNLS